MATCSPETVLAQAAAFQSVDPGTLQVCILQLLCNAQSGGGAGGGATFGNYGGVQPTGITTAGTYVDTSTGAVWNVWYYNGTSWRQG